MHSARQGGENKQAGYYHVSLSFDEARKMIFQFP